ncbi:ABC transporter permease [Herbaspirillum sp. alder98]|uniref:ABC transporter permease n=1 Tax=Herbaspirillum sp. alder98 TaxID=2913096 RepID=UPI001CD8A369|nr:ABC transporter permease [Herbaspirillum sp. alder98]MCA1325616.1 ABC transporter permease [Herbaspirillum sp. alder98]
MRPFIFLEPRAVPSRRMRYGSPLLAALLTLAAGWCLFAAQGQPPWEAMRIFFIEPLADRNGWAELMLKATPICLIALGLSACFKANVWNIGAEGQMLMGGIAASGVALYVEPGNPAWMMMLMIGAAILGGMLWAAVVATLRTCFNTNEILVSLMLTYVASNILIYLVSGPWRDPMGMNFPLTRQFDSDALFALLADDWHWTFWQGTRLNASVLLVPPLVAAMWLFQQKSFSGFKMQVGGLAPLAARYAGFSESGAVWLGLMLSGALAGLAGVGEVAGTIGQLQSSWSPGYGFTAIIVAFVGRLHPVGVVLASLLMALLYLGGESAQTALHLPKSISSVFQGMLLFALLGCDLAVHYRLRLTRRTMFSPMQGGQ